MCSTTDLQEQNARETIATLAPSVKAAAPSTAAMRLHPQSSDGATAVIAPDTGEKRHRHAPEEVEDWLPGMGLGDDADLQPRSQRARLADTSLLFERLVQETAVIRARVIERQHRDQIERDFSRQIAERHPLTWRQAGPPNHHADASTPLHAKSVTCELASPPSDEEHAAAWSQEHAPACARQSAELLNSPFDHSGSHKAALKSKVVEEWRVAEQASSMRGLCS